MQSLQIELSENNILDDLSALCNCPKLQEIDLAGNKIADVDMLKPLVSLYMSSACIYILCV